MIKPVAVRVASEERDWMPWAMEGHKSPETCLLVKQQIGIRVPGVLALLAVPCDNTTTKGMNHLTLPGQLCVCKDECGSVQGVFCTYP